MSETTGKFRDASVVGGVTFKGSHPTLDRRPGAPADTRRSHVHGVGDFSLMIDDVRAHSVFGD